MENIDKQTHFSVFPLEPFVYGFMPDEGIRMPNYKKEEPIMKYTTYRFPYVHRQALNR